MRERLIELLRFPRYQLRGELDLQDCVHDGRYAATDPECLACQAKEECRWLYNNDEFAALSAMPDRRLIKAMIFVIEHMDTLVLQWGHDERFCHCDACEWLRQAREVLGELQVID